MKEGQTQDGFDSIVPNALPKRQRLTKLFNSFNRLKRPIAAFAAVGAILSGFVGYWNTYRTVRETVVAQPPGPGAAADAGPLSIVVLPFTSLISDPARAYLADGLTVSVTGDLGRIHDAFVVDISSAEAYRGKTLTAKQIGKDLGVRFVLRGSVQASGSKIRIISQLADAATNEQLWSESFDGDSSDLFALQDKVTTLISNSMGRELLIRAARDSERYVSDPKAVDLILRAEALILKPMSLENWQQVEGLMRGALVLDRENVAAMIGLGVSLFVQVNTYYFELAQPDIDQKKGEVDRLIALVRARDPENPNLLSLEANVAEWVGDDDKALRLGEQRLERTPKDPVAYNGQAVRHYYRVEPEAALALLQQAVALNPKHPTDVILLNLGSTEFMLGHDQEAIGLILQLNEINTGFYAEPILAMAYARKGMAVEARTAAEAWLKHHPDFTISGFLNHPNPRARAAFRSYIKKQVVPAMRLAGFPE